ncbi:MAG: sugar ABC transporter ATP-binding protein [Lachnospiraceae bacterium]|nr:sugar ABC transporter ATP-binding protein [Lachnospiraceae bacterium]
MGNHLIELKHIRKSFFGVDVLKDLNFSIEKGVSTSLIGENGCGKSTMIKIISGFYEFDYGEIVINGKKYHHLTPIEAMHEGIQVVYQDFSLFPNITVAENIMTNSLIADNRRGIPWKEMTQSAKKALERIGADIDTDILVSELSVAQKQLVAIARAIVMDAKLIIMDEPTSAITYKEIEILLKIVQELNAAGIAVLFVSHKLDEVKAVSKNVSVMRNGNIVYSGGIEGMTQEKMVFYMTGRELVSRTFIYERPNTEPVLQVKGLGLKNYYKDINFDVYEGEVVGITGLLGCGRSELAKSLFGLMPCDCGEIYMHGNAVQIRSVRDAMKSKIAYVPEDRLTEGLHLSSSISDNAIVCLMEKLSSRCGFLNKRKMVETYQEVLNRVSIAGMEYDKEVRMLSGGNQQKVLLLKWIATEPDLLILNCPTVGVDVGSKSDIHELVHKIAETGVSVVVISDDLPEIRQLCNRAYMMHDGMFCNEFKISETTSEEMEHFLTNNIKGREE